MRSFLLLNLAAAAPEILLIARHNGWSVEVSDVDLTMSQLFTASVNSEASAQALATRLQSCSYPEPGAKAEPCPNMCFSAGIPCPGSTDPHCEHTVLMQNGQKPGNQSAIMNATQAYSTMLARLRATDGYIVRHLKTAHVRTQFFCECLDDGKWFPDERRAYACDREEFAEVMRTGKCSQSSAAPMHVDVIMVAGRSQGGWSVELFDKAIATEPLWIANAESESDARAIAARMKQCKYPRPGAKAGEPCPHLCFSAGVPCADSSDPHCERSVLKQNGLKPGEQVILANITNTYEKVLGGLQAPDGYVIAGVSQAVVVTQCYCECQDPHGWFANELRSYMCEREEFDRIVKAGGCSNGTFDVAVMV
eukprot:TRINITY_DN89491_c0_g1_i1.p1 TRINITY_DN89491_c0_g1~~TRINITY_DN89491_c0_g1_i1.p1  ORF type:complete len:365 (-),score=55.76 TRINITY_DN89491_c0_g1_i1:42-1136(-)